MQNINKKGLSEIISVTLVIALAVVAISLLAVYVGRTTAFLSPALSCTELQILSPLSIGSVCFNPSESRVELSLNRNFEALEISSIEFNIQSQQESSQWLCADSCGNCEILPEGSSKNYYFSQISAPESIILRANGCTLLSQDIPSC